MVLLSDDKDLTDKLTCATCIDVTPTMFFMNHFTHSAPVKMRAPELTTCSTYKCSYKTLNLM